MRVTDTEGEKEFNTEGVICVDAEDSRDGEKVEQPEVVRDATGVPEEEALPELERDTTVDLEYEALPDSVGEDFAEPEPLCEGVPVKEEDPEPVSVSPPGGLARRSRAARCGGRRLGRRGGRRGWRGAECQLAVQCDHGDEPEVLVSRVGGPLHG